MTHIVTATTIWLLAASIAALLVSIAYFNPGAAAAQDDPTPPVVEDEVELPDPVNPNGIDRSGTAEELELESLFEPASDDSTTTRGDSQRVDGGKNVKADDESSPSVTPQSAVLNLLVGRIAVNEEHADATHWSLIRQLRYEGDPDDTDGWTLLMDRVPSGHIDPDWFYQDVDLAPGFFYFYELVKHLPEGQPSRVADGGLRLTSQLGVLVYGGEEGIHYDIRVISREYELWRLDESDRDAGYVQVKIDGRTGVDDGTSLVDNGSGELVEEQRPLVDGQFYTYQVNYYLTPERDVTLRTTEVTTVAGRHHPSHPRSPSVDYSEDTDVVSIEWNSPEANADHVAYYELFVETLALGERPVKSFGTTRNLSYEMFQIDPDILYHYSVQAVHWSGERTRLSPWRITSASVDWTGDTTPSCLDANGDEQEISEIVGNNLYVIGPYNIVELAPLHHTAHSVSESGEKCVSENPNALFVERQAFLWSAGLEVRVSNAIIQHEILEQSTELPVIGSQRGGMFFEDSHYSLDWLDENVSWTYMLKYRTCQKDNPGFCSDWEGHLVTTEPATAD